MVNSAAKGKRKRDSDVPESSGKWKSQVYKRRKKEFKVVPVKAPPLCVLRTAWMTSDKQNVVINSDGNIALVNAFAAGRGDDNRHTNQTIMYKFMLQGTCWVHDASSIYVTPIRLYQWLIYDSEPKGALPKASDIFREDWNTIPSTWTVQRAWSNRFVVKRKWHTDLMSDGKKVGSKSIDTRYNYVVARNMVDVNKFYKGLRVSTEWMNTGDGTIGDIKKGALYILSVTRGGLNSDSATQSMNVVCAFVQSCYFKAIGLQ